MRSDPKLQIAQRTPTEWRGYGLLFSSRTLSPTALSLPVWSVIGTMSSDPIEFFDTSFPNTIELKPYPSYEEGVYRRLEESLFEYMEEDMITKLVPAVKRGLLDELKRRREEVTKVEAVIRELFPNEVI